jgi:hypothetical protein
MLDRKPRELVPLSTCDKSCNWAKHTIGNSKTDRKDDRDTARDLTILDVGAISMKTVHVISVINLSAISHYSLRTSLNALFLRNQVNYTLYIYAPYFRYLYFMIRFHLGTTVVLDSIPDSNIPHRAVTCIIQNGEQNHF